MPTSVKTLLSSASPIGYTGSKGDIGFTGSLGSIGYTGSAGFTGSLGPTGFTGSQGSVGFTGSASTVIGFTGSASTVVGFTGSQGDVGFTGSQGSVGFTGSAGTQYTTSSDVQLNSLGIGTPASATTGEIRATNNITAFYTSDLTYKENVQDIPGALDVVNSIGGKLFDWTDEYIASHGGEDGYFVRKQDFGVIAQDVQHVFPRAVRIKDDGTLAVDYEKLCALAFAAIKELSQKVQDLENKLGDIDGA